MEEPNLLVRWIVYLFASGLAGIWGAMGLAWLISRRWLFPDPRRRLVFPKWITCLVLFVCGSPALPTWYFLVSVGLGIALIVFWLRGRFGTRAVDQIPLEPLPFPSALPPKRPAMQSREKWFFAWTLLWLMLTLGLELPQLIWMPPKNTVDRLLVIGDSVTAGLNDGEETWPMILATTSSIELLDASQPGATLQSARRQNERFSGLPGTVILEIGGNDLLEGLPVDQFEANLERLLSEVNQPDRTMVMFELPLPPFCTRYGGVQRRLASRHGVHLIPKTVFAWLITSRGATVDGVHLSAAGQRQMAQQLALLFAKTMKSGKGEYQHVGR